MQVRAKVNNQTLERADKTLTDDCSYDSSLSRSGHSNMHARGGVTSLSSIYFLVK